MHILIIKTSSLGDVIHTLPALSDALQHYPNLQCDWVVEEAFAEIPSWHPLVKQVIPVALRRWRKHPWQIWISGSRAHTDWHNFIQTVRLKQYDKVIDAQGLLKSALLTYKARGLRCGLDYKSARESLAALAYQRRYAIPKNQHAVTRIRQLFAAVLDYPTPDFLPDYRIKNHFFRRLPPNALPTIIFLHGTTWITKHWPETYWLALAQRVTAAGFAVRLPWGNPQEYNRAQQIATIHPNISLIPKSNLYNIATELAQAQAVVAVDTGLAHLAAALGVPSVTIYGATDPTRTGTYGPQQKHLTANNISCTLSCAPCLKKNCAYKGEGEGDGQSTVSPACYEYLSVDKVFYALWELLEKTT